MERRSFLKIFTGVVAAAVVAPPKLVALLTPPVAAPVVYTGVTRKELLKTGYLGDLWSANIHVSSSARYERNVRPVAHVYFRNHESDKWSCVPEFEIASCPQISIREIKARRFFKAPCVST